MTLLECSSIAKNTDSRKKQYDYGIFEVQPISYKMECLDMFRHMSIHAYLCLKWLGSTTKPWDPTQWLYWIIPNSVHIDLKLLFKSGCWKTEILTKWMVQTGPNSVHPKNHSVPPLSTNIAFFYKMAGVEKKLRVWIFKGISMHFPSIPRCFGILFYFLTKWLCVKRLTSPSRGNSPGDCFFCLSNPSSIVKPIPAEKGEAPKKMVSGGSLAETPKRFSLVGNRLRKGNKKLSFLLTYSLKAIFNMFTVLLFSFQEKFLRKSKECTYFQYFSILADYLLEQG